MHLAGTVQQHVLTVNANKAQKYRQYRRQHQTAIFERIPHRVAPGSNVTLEHMGHRLQVAGFVMRLDAVGCDHILRVVMTGFLPHVMVTQVVVMIVAVMKPVVVSGFVVDMFFAVCGILHEAIVGNTFREGVVGPVLWTLIQGNGDRHLWGMRGMIGCLSMLLLSV